MTVNNIVSKDDLPGNSKEVRFHKIVKTILVPEKSEYNSHLPPGFFQTNHSFSMIFG